MRSGRSSWGPPRRSATPAAGSRHPRPSSSLAGYARLTDINQFFNGAASRGTLEKKGTTTYNGQKVIAIVDNTKNGGTYYVAASGKPYPVAILGGTGSKAGAIRFSDWNQRVSVTAPKGAIPLPLG